MELSFRVLDSFLGTSAASHHAPCTFLAAKDFVFPCNGEGFPAVWTITQGKSPLLQKLKRQRSNETLFYIPRANGVVRIGGYLFETRKFLKSVEPGREVGRRFSDSTLKIVPVRPEII